MTSTASTPDDFDVVCDYVAATFPNSNPEWNGLVVIPWHDPAGICVDEYIDGDTVMRVGVYPNMENPDWCALRDCRSAEETIALLTHLTEDQPEGVDWAAWAVLRAAEWVRTPDRECADHFVGSETLRCPTCGWDEATHAYRDVQ